MHIDFLLQVFRENSKKDALIWKCQAYSYQWLLDRIGYWKDILNSQGIPKNKVVVVEADFSPNAVALLIALIDYNSIIVPLTKAVQSKKEEFIEIAQAEFSFAIDENDNVTITQLSERAYHELYEELKRREHPGLVLFSSGSTGRSKAAVHDIAALCEKFKIPGKSLRTITFLLYDHIGGINTLFHTLSRGGTIITIQDRSPDSVLEAVEKHKAEP